MTTAQVEEFRFTRLPGRVWGVVIPRGKSVAPGQLVTVRKASGATTKVAVGEIRDRVFIPAANRPERQRRVTFTGAYGTFAGRCRCEDAPCCGCGS